MTNAAPRVSVVTIFRNAERYLGEAITSVFGQTYADWELVLVDDGSQDHSSHVACEWSTRYPDRVRCVEHPGGANRGMSASRNLGLRHSRSEYVAFLDADDVWFPHKLSQQVPLLDSWPEAAMLYGVTQWWYSWTGHPEDLERDFVHPLGVKPHTLIQPPELIAPCFLRQDTAIPSQSSALLRRAAVERVGGFEESFRGMYEDQAFYAKLLANAPVVASPQCWDRYRQHPSSCVAAADQTGRAYAARITFLTWFANYLTRHGFTDRRLHAELQTELRRCRHPVFNQIANRARFAARHPRQVVRGAVAHTLPAPVTAWVKARVKGDEYRPPPGWVRFGDLRRITPVSRGFGFARGLPVDRYYIERFLAAHASDIGGEVLEVADNVYSHRFGQARLKRVEVLHLTGDDAHKTTLIGDLADGRSLASDSWDCVILTQTLQFVFDVPGALATVHRILRPGGVLLATVPGISQISRYDMERWGQYWAFTTQSMQRLLGVVFSPDAVDVESAGNVLAATALLQGLASAEIGKPALDYVDSDYQVIITARAVKSKPPA